MPHRDLVRCLRALDVELAASSPSPRLEARLRARLHAACASRRWPPGGDLARMGWGLGFAVVASIVLLAGPVRRIELARALAGGAPDPIEVLNEKLHADAGPPEPEIGRRRAAPPRIHAPALSRPSARDDRQDAVPAPARSPAPIDVDRPAPEQAPRVEDADSAPRPRARPPGAAPVLGRDYVDPSRGSARPGPLGSFVPPGRPHAPESAGTLFTPATQAVPATLAPPAAPHTLDSAAACFPLSALKDGANALCKEKGLMLVDCSVGDPCGDGTYQILAKCAPPSPGPSCIADVVGDGSTCVDEHVLAMEADAICNAVGLAVAVLDYSQGACGKQVSFAKYTCCPSSPAPAPPGKYGALGDGSTCVDIGDLKAQATVLCKEAGLPLAEFAYDPATCGDGQATIVKYSCGS